jgi:hypothetical protein
MKDELPKKAVVGNVEGASEFRKDDISGILLFI